MTTRRRASLVKPKVLTNMIQLLKVFRKYEAT